MTTEATETETEAEAAETPEQGQAEWWSTGYDEMETIPEGSSDDRHYMKANTERTVIVLDGNANDKELFKRLYGAPFCIWEYQLPQKEEGGTNWRYWATCVRTRKNADGSPMKDYVKQYAPAAKPYYIGFYTIVDITEVDLQEYLESGKPLPDSCYKKLLGGKRKLLKILKRHAIKKKGLRGCVYTVFRGTKEDPNTGNDWQMEEKLSDDELKKLLPEGKDIPFEYAELLAPLPEGEIQGLMPNLAKITPYGKKGDKDKDGQSEGRQSRREAKQDDVGF